MAGTNGASANGGIGGDDGVFGQWGGGAGGGGYFGGGGGGGGSSYAEPGASGVVHTQGVQPDDGKIVINY